MEQVVALAIHEGTVPVLYAKKHDTFWRLYFHNFPERMRGWLMHVEA